ncbi:MAG: Putative major facilitator superfamily transporter [Leptospirillum sp. Group II 'C75']|jgi:MFS family permease|uniref:Putative major facilitator superfamily transporter n=1 Tax=Leptospirillum sp. Group II '5-way CG' TaxID=419541 RepID=B6ARY3_9BACT|nr:MFS transporter [Leptospirillum sp. Group II 'CF-1']AKS23142.1 MFS transporter [Leptospirillum sp. Group II 'CF-1']EAY57029.1 MAG: putative major facilitator superfamily transporter [Leptospirillum rubarum]EDZ38229.1 MAG: Putative major facilitator superfamily transporter [Leptospirillum sp. Group II '5-way CG']EIJ75221.1 MAG: Putative major facilitator superfamily transporter [Leptospirillum sp. Group II 'C75']
MTGYPRGIRPNIGQFLQQILQVFFVGLMIGMERTVLPTLAQKDFGVARGSFLFLLSFVLSFGLVKGALNFVAGSLSDRIGRKRVLLMGWIAGIPIPFLILMAHNWWWVVVANVFLGVNQGFAWSMTVTSKVDITRPEERGMATGINESAGYLAVGIAGIVTGYLAARYGPRDTLFGFGLSVVILGAGMAAAFVRETLPWALAEHEEHRTGTAAFPLPRYPKNVSEHPGPGEIFLLVSFRHPTFRALSQAGIANKIADTLVWGLFPVFFLQRGLALAEIGWISGLFALVWGFAQLGTGALSDRIGRKFPIVAGLWCLGGGVAAMALSDRLSLWLLSSVAMGFGMALLYPNLVASVADISPPAWRGKALGTYRYWRDTGYAIGAIFLGVLAQWRQEVVVTFWMTSALLLLSGVWVALGAEETHPRKNPKNGEIQRGKVSPFSCF